jgi:hypothetical protein
MRESDETVDRVTALESRVAELESQLASLASDLEVIRGTPFTVGIGDPSIADLDSRLQAVERRL